MVSESGTFSVARKENVGDSPLLQTHKPVESNFFSLGVAPKTTIETCVSQHTRCAVDVTVSQTFHHEVVAGDADWLRGTGSDSDQSTFGHVVVESAEAVVPLRATVEVTVVCAQVIQPIAERERERQRERERERRSK